MGGTGTIHSTGTGTRVPRLLAAGQAAICRRLRGPGAGLEVGPRRGAVARYGVPVLVLGRSAIRSPDTPSLVAISTYTACMGLKAFT